MALSGKSIRNWYLVHKWSSLICSVFLLMLCITGLPLIFHDEIDQLTQAPVTQVSELSEVAAEDSLISLEAVVHEAKAENPGWVLMFLTWNKDKSKVSAVLGETMEAEEGDVHIIPFDSQTGKRLLLSPPNEGVMHFLLDLHASLLMGLPGTLFLGLMGFVFMVSVVSGAVVYAPFMRRLPFAIVRKGCRSRVKWLDMHNMAGIITLAWVSVVGITGLILTMITPITAIWQQGQLADIAAPYKGIRPPTEQVSPDVVRGSIFNQVPDADISFISWPGSPFATPHHYTVALRGDTPLTERLITVALVDARTGTVTAIEKTPWYISMINLSVPLHFGDYGGLPLKVIWALLDIAAIIVLGSGLYLWLARRNKSIEKRLAELNIMPITESD